MCKPSRTTLRPIPRILTTILLFGSLTGLSALPVMGEVPDVEEVIVEAFRLPATLFETGSSIWVVDEAMIKARGYVQMTDVLTSVPGLTINQNGTFGGQASARIRGASSEQTLVLLDGIMINDVSTPGGGFNFGTFDVSDVARVEALIAAPSTLQHVQHR